MTSRLKSRTAENSRGKGLSPRFVPRRRQSFRKYNCTVEILDMLGLTTAYTFKLHVSRKDNAHNHRFGVRNPNEEQAATKESMRAIFTQK